MFDTPQLWDTFSFDLDTKKDPDGRSVRCVDKYGTVLKRVTIRVNQSEKVSRDRAVYILKKLSSLEKKNLKSFTFQFSGRNPLCFNGRDILSEIKSLLKSNDSESASVLTNIDFNKLDIPLDNDLVNILAANHRHLSVVSIQNKCLHDNVTPDSIMKLVKGCPSMIELHTFYHAIDAEILEYVAEDDKLKLRKMHLRCNRSDKYGSRILSETWATVTKSKPSFVVAFSFSSNFPRHLMIPVLCCNIPLFRISLEVYNWLNDELEHISNCFYETLEYISFHTSLDHNRKAPPGLEPVLRSLVHKCEKLEELHCFCCISEDLVTEIRELRSFRKSTLYSTPVTFT